VAHKVVLILTLDLFGGRGGTLSCSTSNIRSFSGGEHVVLIQTLDLFRGRTGTHSCSNSNIRFIQGERRHTQLF
jgi:hypothetical protein